MFVVVLFFSLCAFFDSHIHEENNTYGLIHIILPSFCGTLANSAEPDQMPQNAPSNQVLHCLLAEYSFKI